MFSRNQRPDGRGLAFAPRMSSYPHPLQVGICFFRPLTLASSLDSVCLTVSLSTKRWRSDTRFPCSECSTEQVRSLLYTGGSIVRVKRLSDHFIHPQNAFSSLFGVSPLTIPTEIHIALTILLDPSPFPDCEASRSALSLRTPHRFDPSGLF